VEGVVVPNAEVVVEGAPKMEVVGCAALPNTDGVVPNAGVAEVEGAPNPKEGLGAPKADEPNAVVEAPNVAGAAAVPNAGVAVGAAPKVFAEAPNVGAGVVPN